MKTTNFEVSKKLKEIGFNVETEYYWHDINGKTELHHVAREGLGDYKSYDLETILDALPARIEKNEKLYDLLLRHNILGYYATSLKLDYDNIQLDDYIFELYDHDKSLADTAGRLLIELFEAGIVNFNK